MITLPNGNIVPSYSSLSGGIANYPKNAQDNEAAFERSIDYRTNPYELTLLPKTVKESGSVVLGLPKDGDLVGTDLYYYDDTGSIYKRTAAGSHSLLRTVANSHGNGMKYYAEDDFLYYTSDKVIGRYGQISGTPTFVDDFLGSEGGIPLNTYSLDLEASSSQYASRADTASLSITGDLAIECSIKPESLPTAGNSMVLFSKWDVNGNIRSYKFELYAVSGYFGDGSDSSLTISSNTTEAPIDSACTGTSGTTSLSATNASFVAGQIILIHQTRGTGAGTAQKNKIASYVAGTITLETALNASYVSGAQVRVLKQYTNVTVDATFTYSAKAWNGTVGGILAFLANGTITANGTLSAGLLGPGAGYSTNNQGFRGATTSGGQGEGTTGAGDSVSTSANGSGGGGGSGAQAGGGGGGHSASGSTGTASGGGTAGTGGGTSGTADLTTLTFGGAGGRGGGTSGEGGFGGGIVFIAGSTVTINASTGYIKCNGSDGQSGASPGAGGGAGGGGSILVKAQTATLNTNRLLAEGGNGGSGAGGGNGGDGSDGRIHLDYYTSYTGTTTPTLDVLQDNNLVTNTTYQLRLGLSSNGTAEEFLTKATTIMTGTWFHVGVSWDASASTATFFQDGVSLGTSVGAVTSLNNNASRAGLGCDFNNAARNFYDGLIDEVRVWATERTAAQMFANKGVEIAVNSAGMVAYYQLDNNYDDSFTGALNTLTASNAPVFSVDVPFSSPTTRLDLDQGLDTTTNAYTLTTAINEGATHRQTFVPTKDPQKSVQVLVATIGTGTWTITVHDVLNRVVATASKTTGQMSTGDVEFTFTTAWRPILGATYHFHITSTVADGTVTCTTSDDLETVDFHTYYQFLVTDTDYHPVEQFLNFLVVGNGRYLAKYAADGVYEPHRLTFPAGWRVRCFGFWRGYIAIGLWRGTNIYDTDQGAIALWDGKSDTYDEFIYIPEGAINALLGSRGVLHVWAGYHGDMLEYRGGDYAVKKENVPKMSKETYIEIMPKAVTMWDGLLRWGVAGNSDNSDVERGVYTWGKQTEDDPESLSYDYPLSTGNRANSNIKVGFCIPVAKKFLIGFKDNVSYGMDVVDPAGSPFATGTIEKGIQDLGSMVKEKQLLTLRADFKALASGESIRLKYRLNRSSSWIQGADDNEKGYAATVGDTFARLNVPMGNHKEMEIAADLAATGSTSPSLLELAPEINPKKSEGIV